MTNLVLYVKIVQYPSAYGLLYTPWVYQDLGNIIFKYWYPSR